MSSENFNPPDLYYYIHAVSTFNVLLLEEDINNIQALDSQWRIADKFPGDATVGKAGIPYTNGQISMFGPVKSISQNETDARVADLQNHYENLFQTQSESGAGSRSGSDSGLDSSSDSGLGSGSGSNSGLGLGSGADSRSAIFLKNKKTFTIQIDDETEFELRKFKQKLEKERKEPVDWNLILKEMVKRVGKTNEFRPTKAIKSAALSGARTSHCEIRAEDTKTQQNVKHKLRSNPRITLCRSAKPTPNREPKQSKITRHIPAKIKRALEQKHNGRCAYRGCNKPAEQIHHPKRFATKPNHENLVPLCKAHHDFVHQTNPDSIFNFYKNEKIFQP